MLLALAERLVIWYLKEYGRNLDSPFLWNNKFREKFSLITKHVKLWHEKDSLSVNKFIDILQVTSEISHLSLRIVKNIVQKWIESLLQYQRKEEFVIDA